MFSDIERDLVVEYIENNEAEMGWDAGTIVFKREKTLKSGALAVSIEVRGKSGLEDWSFIVRNGRVTQKIQGE